MCMIDDSDGAVTMIREATHVARKAHKCRECFREIQPGETYRAEFYTCDGARTLHKTCAHCMVARQWLLDECGGFLFGGVEEDLREHCHNGVYPMSVHRLAVGIAWRWRTPSGRLLPVPSVPPTTHERT